MVLLKKKVSLGLILVLLASCTKEVLKEKTILAERQSERKIEDSVQTNSNQIGTNSISISKSALGKAFLLLPKIVRSGKMPTSNYLRPMVVSFEKSSDKIGLFNLTEEQLYSSIASSRLVQSFEIVKETEAEITIDMSKGFLSLPLLDQIGWLEKEAFTKLKEESTNAIEKGITVKDSFVRSVTHKNNAIFIEQIVRLTDVSTKNNETGATVLIEIKPYTVNSKYVSKNFDKTQKVGYFINFANKSKVEEIIPQITKWSIDKEHPIVVHLHEDTPLEVQQTIIEGVNYWNRIFQFEALKLGEKFKSLDPQNDRSIQIYWLKWDSAGFARAGLQADPMTGEIIRGQILLTSSWLNTGLESPGSIQKKSNSQTNTEQNSVCNFDQTELYSDIEKKLIKPEQRDVVTQDVVRSVVAHEMGHVLGLRHNFAGSYAIQNSDEELLKSEEEYLGGNAQNIVPATSTVMDYLPIANKAALGRYIQTKTLSYDVTAIKWAYFNETADQDTLFCTDEHISYATDKKLKIYGCDRRDKFKNLISASIEKLLLKEKNKAELLFKEILDEQKSAESNYKIRPKIEDVLDGISLWYVSTTSFNDYFYQSPSKAFYTVPFVIKNFFKYINDEHSEDEDSLISDIISKDSKKIGGYEGVLNRFLALYNESKGQLYQKQLPKLFSEMNTDYFSTEELEKIKAKFIEEAKTADELYLSNIIRTLPLVKKIYTINASTKAPTINEVKYSSAFYLGDVKKIAEIYAKAYTQAIRMRAITLKINDTEAVYHFRMVDTGTLNRIRLLFTEDAYKDKNISEHKEFLENQKAELKKMSVENTLNILKLVQVDVKDLATSDDLEKAVEALKGDVISSEAKKNIEMEIAELKAWEMLDKK